MKQSSSEPLEEKPPFLTEEDAKTFAQSNFNIPFIDMDFETKANFFYLERGYKAATEQANEKISSLESELKALMDEREKMLTWITDRYDFVDGDWYIKMDLDGDDPLSHSEIVKAYTLNTEKKS